MWSVGGPAAGGRAGLAANRKPVRHDRVVGTIVRILGPVVVDRDGGPGVALGPKPRLVLAVLAAHRGTVVSTDRLCDALWGDDQPVAALATLQSHVSRVRRSVGSGGELVALDRGYRLDLPPGGLDLDHFESRRTEAEGAHSADAEAALRAALGWWRGAAFGELADNPWVRSEALRLDELRLTVTEDWIEHRLGLGGDGALVGDLQGFADAHPLRERFQRQRLVALYREGRHVEALRRAEEFRSLLRDGMGLDPSPAFALTERQVLAGDPAIAAFVPVGRRRPPAVEPTRLVGRAAELARIREAVLESSLVTLVGPGGVGKTRLARRIAATLDDLDEAPAFVELASVRDDAALPDAMATALDVQPRLNLTMEDALVAALAERRQLVVFDNCEHLLDALVPFIDRVRARCPHVRVLATSREPLGLPSEVVLPVAPLTVTAAGTDDPEEIAAAEAVQLLVDRVAASVPGFEVTDANALVLGEICRRLDGLPLAVELVAARFRSLDPETILQRLVGPAAVLGASMRSADPRHRTLRDTIDWSYSHLNDDEQRLFARLSAFSGSFDLPSVEAVCGGDLDVVGRLASLVDKSMVQRVSTDGSRYQLLETLREYAREQLAGLEPPELVLDAHLRWYTTRAQEASVGLTGPCEATWSRRIDGDFDDFRVAFGRACRTGNPDAALRLVAGLREYAFRHIRYELAAWAVQAVELPGAPGHPRYAVVLAIVSYGHYVRGELAASVEVGRRAVAEHHDAHDSSGLAERSLGNALFYLGSTDEAVVWMDQMVVSARRGSPARLAHALYMRSVAETSVGRTVRGAVLAGEALAAASASGSPTARAQAAYALGLALEGTEPDESLRLLRESAEVAGTAGNRWIEAFAQTEVWWLEARRGDVRTALAKAGVVIETWHRGGDWANLHLSLRRVFGLLVQLGDHHAAAVLHGALQAAGATSARPYEPRSALDEAAAAQGLLATLGADHYELAVARGNGLSVAELEAFVQARIAALCP